MKKLFLAALLLPNLAIADVWIKSEKNLVDFLELGFEVVGFDVDSGTGPIGRTRLRYLLQIKSPEHGNRLVLCSEYSTGGKQQCWVTRKPSN